MANDDFDNERTDRWMSERFSLDRDRRSPTPWTRRGREVICRFGYLAEFLEPDDARRTVACVNALRDVSTAALEELIKEERELELALTLSTMMKSEPSSERSKG